MKHPEDNLQRATVEFLRLALPEDEAATYAWWACPNGGKRGKATAAILRGTGTKAGQPDLEFVLNGRLFFIELKAQGRGLNDAQRWRIPLLKRAGCTVEVCRTVEEVEDALRSWDFPLRATTGSGWKGASRETSASPASASRPHLLEQCNRQADEIERLSNAIRLDIDEARATCGGDGLGCEAFRPYYDNPERRYRKCGQCPMEALSNVREATA